MYEPMSVSEILKLVQHGIWTGEQWEVDMYKKGEWVEWEDMGSVKSGKIMSYEFADFHSGVDVYSVDIGTDYPVYIHESRMTRIRGGDNE